MSAVELAIFVAVQEHCHNPPPAIQAALRTLLLVLFADLSFSGAVDQFSRLLGNGTSAS